MKVKELMTTDVGFCHSEDNITKAAEIMQHRDCGIVPVIDAENRVVGIVTDRDICIAVATQHKTISRLEANDLIGGSIVACSANDEIEDALEKMRKNQIKRLLVTGKKGELVGILSITDVLISTGKNKKLKKKVYSTMEKIFQPRPIVLQEITGQ